MGFFYKILIDNNYFSKYSLYLNIEIINKYIKLMNIINILVVLLSKFWFAFQLFFLLLDSKLQQFLFQSLNKNILFVCLLNISI